MITEDKALALVNEVRRARGLGPYFECDRTCAEDEALCRAIEQREAAEQELNDFKQEVSDAVVEYIRGAHPQNLGQFIIPKPKPDPLEEVLSEIDHAAMWVDECAKEIRASLDARGFEIREKNDD